MSLSVEPVVLRLNLIPAQLASVVPNPGYKLVDNSLIYKKNTAMTYGVVRKTLIGKRELNTVIIPAMDAQNGTYFITMPNSDIVVSALFELCQYSITYSDMTADIINPNPESYTINSSIVLEDATKEGYNFLGWYDQDGNRILKISNRTGNLVLTPMFQLIEVEEEPDDPAVTPPGDEPGNTPSDKPSEKPSDMAAVTECPFSPFPYAIHRSPHYFYGGESNR